MMRLWPAKQANVDGWAFACPCPCSCLLPYNLIIIKQPKKNDRTRMKEVNTSSIFRQQTNGSKWNVFPLKYQAIFMEYPTDNNNNNNINGWKMFSIQTDRHLIGYCAFSQPNKQSAKRTKQTNEVTFVRLFSQNIGQ